MLYDVTNIAYSYLVIILFHNNPYKPLERPFVGHIQTVQIQWRLTRVSTFCLHVLLKFGKNPSQHP